jgi:hypothetical protein
MPPRYPEWLQYLFDRPVTSNGWYFDVDPPNFEAENIDLVALITHTMENGSRDLAGYSDAQVSHGLKYIINNACSDVVFSLMSDTVPVALRLRAIDSIKVLYRDCFTPRCAPVLCHNDAPGANPLNTVCYMLWDTSPLAYWDKAQSKEVFYRAIVGVMEAALASPNPACVESGLHGLGHIQAYYPEQVLEVISTFQRRNIFVAPQLRAYAQQASVGCVQ